MVSVLPSSFSDRVFTRTAKIYISKETRFVSRRSVELSVKKTNYTWKDRVHFFFFVRAENQKEVSKAHRYRETEATTRRSEATRATMRRERRKSEGESLYARARGETNRRRRCVVIAQRGGACLVEHVHA